ncbi:hypothetical protein NDA13_002623 [Ustilago tritici]|nr:hypothetical protein NDA13_002623 [Ustilago tritici]
MGDSSYKGVSASQDSRFSNKESTLLRKLTFPPHFNIKVDMRKVELSVIKPWIARRVTELLGFEDDVVLEYASGMLEEERFPDPRKVQIQLMGFLEGKTAEFMSELWELLVSAQESVGGVPKRFVEEKKEELRKKREEGERVVREARERAARAAESAGASGEAAAREGKRRSRWDAGAPTTSAPAGEVDRRPPAYTRGRDREQPPLPRDDYRRRDDRSTWNRRDDRNSGNFRDRNGNNTDRSRDSGWGSRAPQQADSYRPSRRSPSPPPRHRQRSPSPVPPPRSSPPPRSPSRSRSVTPDYRAAIRENKRSAQPSRPKHPKPEDREDASNRDALKVETLREKFCSQPGPRFKTRREEPEEEEDAYKRGVERSAFRDMVFSDSESEDRLEAERSRQKMSRSDLSSDDDELEPPSDAEKEHERDRERELRNKLLRAKSSRSSKKA